MPGGGSRCDGGRRGGICEAVAGEVLEAHLPRLAAGGRLGGGGSVVGLRRKDGRCLAGVRVGGVKMRLGTGRGSDADRRPRRWWLVGRGEMRGSMRMLVLRRVFHCWRRVVAKGRGEGRLAYRLLFGSRVVGE